MLKVNIPRMGKKKEDIMGRKEERKERRARVGMKESQRKGEVKRSEKRRGAPYKRGRVSEAPGVWTRWNQEGLSEETKA